jgi:hypothetical protein
MKKQQVMKERNVKRYGGIELRESFNLEEEKKGKGRKKEELRE